MADEPDGHDGGEPVALDVAIDEAMDACDGDARATIGALLVLVESMEGELASLKDEVARVESAVSGGYVRRVPVRRREPGEA